MWYTYESTLTVSLPSARAHRRFCELLPQEQRSVEESLQARVSLEQILSLPELKVPAPQPPSATPSEVTWSLLPILVFSLFHPKFLGALSRSSGGVI